VLSVTEKAVGALADSLESSEASGEQSLRLARTPQGEFGLAIDEERDGDQVVKLEEKAILVLDEEISTALDGAILDIADSPEGQRLTLRLPEDG
jgi:Fe-S cluster assembly iron-binding protein IscA